MRRVVSMIAGVVAVMLLCPPLAARASGVSQTVNIVDIDKFGPDTSANPANYHYVPAFMQCATLGCTSPSARSILLPADSTVTWKDLDSVGPCIDPSCPAPLHAVASYYAQNPASAFASPALSTASSCDGGNGSGCTVTSYTATYHGGTLLYRCVYMSSLDNSVSPPACEGMCGAIQDTAADTTPPSVTITTANGFVFTGGVRIDGRATDNRAVVDVRMTITPLAESQLPVHPVATGLAQTGLSTDADPMNPCRGCYGPSALWTFHRLPDVVVPSTAVLSQPPQVVLPPGAYEVAAQAEDPHGNLSTVQKITIYSLGYPDTINRAVTTVQGIYDRVA